MATTFSNYEVCQEDFYYHTTFVPKKKSGLRYYLRCVKWLWKNRDWANTRQKFKAMDKECNL